MIAEDAKLKAARQVVHDLWLTEFPAQAVRVLAGECDQGTTMRTALAPVEAGTALAAQVLGGGSL